MRSLKELAADIRQAAAWGDWLNVVLLSVVFLVASIVTLLWYAIKCLTKNWLIVGGIASVWGVVDFYTGDTVLIILRYASALSVLIGVPTLLFLGMLLYLWKLVDDEEGDPANIF